MMKRVIVMGASSGMGREVARQFLLRGWRVGLAARRTEPMQALQAEFPGQVEVECVDVCSDEAPAQLLRLADRLGGMSLYFHAAGIGRQNMSLEPGIEMQTVATNAMGFTRMVAAAFAYFSAHGGGHIAVISSIAGTKGLGAAPSYSATKAFQNTYVQSLEQLAHMRRLPIAFTDIRPGFVDTPLLGDGTRYPLLMKAPDVARLIVRAVERRRHVCVVDWRYRVLVFFWRLVPDALWRRLSVRTAD